MNEGQCDERLKLELRNLHVSHTLDPLTPKSTRKVETLTRAPSTIGLCHKTDTTLTKWSLTQYCSSSCILETKTKVGSTTVKVPVPRTHPNIDETPPDPNHPPTHHTNVLVERVIQRR